MSSTASSSSRPSTSSTPLSSIPITPRDEPLVDRLHAFYCFDILVSKLEHRDPIAPPFKSDDNYALFVTWNTSSHSRPNKKPALRGCIGTFSPMPLAKGLRDYALISALEDHRFSPIKSSELPSLSVAISLLTPFTPIPDPLAWVPGTHGIHIAFPHPSHPSRSLSATYLPEVCTEQGWSREECVLSAIQKAGYRGTVRVGDEVWRSLKVRVYCSEKVGATWDEYIAWKTAYDKDGEQDAQEEGDEDAEV